MFAEACGEALGRGLWVVGSRGVEHLRRSPILALVVLFGALALLRISRVDARRLREVSSNLMLHGSRLSHEALAHHAALMSELMPSLFQPAEQASGSLKVARALVRYPNPLSAEAIASGIGSEPDPVLDVLRAHPAFDFWPGHGWTLGYHLDPPQALPRASGSAKPISSTVRS
jgi:hypothetical protein